MLKDKKFFETLGAFLRAKRLEAGLSQDDVAKNFGYSTAQFVSNWERGLAAPPLKTLRRLIDIYGCDAKEVYEIVLGEQKKILKRELLGGE